MNDQPNNQQSEAAIRVTEKIVSALPLLKIYVKEASQIATIIDRETHTKDALELAQRIIQDWEEIGGITMGCYEDAKTLVKKLTGEQV